MRLDQRPGLTMRLPSPVACGVTETAAVSSSSALSSAPDAVTEQEVQVLGQSTWSRGTWSQASEELPARLAASSQDQPLLRSSRPWLPEFDAIADSS